MTRLCVKKREIQVTPSIETVQQKKEKVKTARQSYSTKVPGIMHAWYKALIIKKS